MNKTERMVIKIVICLIGIIVLILLAAVLFIKKVEVQEEEKEPVHIPVVETLHNVWITEIAENAISVFNDETAVYTLSDGLIGQLEGRHREQIADVVLTDGLVSDITLKNEKRVSGKILRVSAGEGVELEGHGLLPYDENVKIYRLYDSLKRAGEQELRVGYSFCDFVMHEGKICGVLITRDEAMEYIRVQIKASDYAAKIHENVRFTCDSDFLLKYADGESVTEEFHMAGEVIDITFENAYGTDRIYVIPEALTARITLLSVSRTQGNPSYRGTMEFALSEEGIYVINEVLLEEYLYAVVPSEMPVSYPAEALKAQAICARTYAYGHMLKNSAKLYGAHVDDSTTYQVYNNVAEHENTTNAVKETSGILLYVPGEMGEELADTYYYSTSCGYGTETDIWKSKNPINLSYLPSKRIGNYVTPVSESEDGEKYTANSLMDEDVFAEFISQTFENDFEAEEPWYRWQYTVEELDTEHMLSALQSQYQANENLVLTKNKKGKFVSKPVQKLDEITGISVIARNEGGIAEELLIETESAVIKVISQGTIRAVLCDGHTKVVRQNGSKVDMPSLLPSAFFVISTSKDEENVVGYTLTGGGFGHGVGMSQNSARSMARQGMTAQEILHFFYENSSVKQIY